MASQRSEVGREIVETAKDHLARTLVDAPPEGWTAVEWAAESGLLVEPSSFPAVLAHHLAALLVHEGRARQVGESGLPRWVAMQGAASARPPLPLAVAAEPEAPARLWSDLPSTQEGPLEIERQAEVDGLGGAFPEGSADEGVDRPPDGHGGPWIP